MQRLKKSPSLYHYTNVSAIHSILSNRSLWFTDLRYLNDSNELRDGVTFLLQSLDKLRATQRAKKLYSEEAITYIQEQLPDIFDDDLPDMQFAFSFSRVFDQLSQWRAYGKYIIEFDEEMLLPYLDRLANCIYIKEEKEELAFNAVVKAVDIVSDALYESDGVRDSEFWLQLSLLYDLATTFKDVGFFEENEVRALTTIHEFSSKSNVAKFRVKGDLVVPFMEIPFSIKCIKAIHIGPMDHQRLAYQSMKTFVNSISKLCFHETKEYPGIEVTTSSIPFREI